MGSGGARGLTVSAGLVYAAELRGRGELVNLANRRTYAAKQAGEDHWLWEMKGALPVASFQLEAAIGDS